MSKKKRIVVAMSGGVDSSTVAAMLKDQGHEVIGITLQLYDVNKVGVKRGTCCAGIDIYDAKNVAEKLGIPHYVLDYESRFKQSVIEDFADSYLRGETPIPCVKCNQTVKFSDLYKMAQDLGAESLATGHYVKKIMGENGPEMHRGQDPKKDQSYFMFVITKDQLNFLDFPLGGFSKDETRKLAKKYGLENADKPDSQDICFVPNGDYASIIEKFRPGALDKGNIVDVDGNVLGQHEGIINFTIGQRRGIGVAGPEPYYVIKIDAPNNNVIVGPEKHLFSTDFFIKDTNWLVDIEKIIDTELPVEVKIRSTREPKKARIFYERPGIYRVSLSEPEKSITPGQACVVYSGTHVLGGGWIMNHL